MGVSSLAGSAFNISVDYFWIKWPLLRLPSLTREGLGVGRLAWVERFRLMRNPTHPRPLPSREGRSA
jgi:hypothetical protein